MSTNLEIIRELGTTEAIYDYEVMNGALMISRAFLVQLDKKYKLDIEILRNACEIWIQQHSFLRAYVKRDHKDFDYFEINNKKQFIYLSENKLTNLSYFELNESEKDNWIEFNKKDLYDPFELENEALWRIKLIKIINSNEKTNDDYVFIYTNSHVIGDGKNSAQIIMQLFQIINCLLQNKTYELSTYDSKYSMEFLAEKLYSDKFDKQEQYCFDFSRVCIPKSIGTCLNTQLFDYFNIDGKKVKKLIEISKLKQKSAKMTSILTTVIFLAFKSVLSKREAKELSDIDLNDFLKVEVLVSVRGKFNLSDVQMGVYSVVVENRVKSSELSFDTFWDVAGEQSKSLHDRIKSHQDIQNIDLMSCIDILNDKTKNFGLYNLLSFSNIGRIEYDNVNGLIKLKEQYMFETLRDRGLGGYLLFGVASIPQTDTMCISLNSVDRYYSREFIKELKTEILFTIDNLID